MKIKNATVRTLLIYTGGDTSPEPEEAQRLEPKQEEDIDLKEFDRLVINDLTNKTENPMQVTKEEFERVVRYVRDAAWTNRGEKNV